jgi:hypothetical protein
MKKISIITSLFILLANLACAQEDKKNPQPSRMEVKDSTVSSLSSQPARAEKNNNKGNNKSAKVSGQPQPARTNTSRKN